MFNTFKPYKAKNLLIKKTEQSIETGFVIVSVYTALGAIPISNAEVSVYTWTEENGRNLVKTVYTDISGRAPIIDLPILLEGNGMTNEEQTRTEYHLAVIAEGYHTTVVINVQIYPDITTQFKIILTPLPSGGINIDKTITIPDIIN